MFSGSDGWLRVPFGVPRMSQGIRRARVTHRLRWIFRTPLVRFTTPGLAALLPAALLPAALLPCCLGVLIPARPFAAAWLLGRVSTCARHALMCMRSGSVGSNGCKGDLSEH